MATPENMAEAGGEIVKGISNGPPQGPERRVYQPRPGGLLAGLVPEQFDLLSRHLSPEQLSKVEGFKAEVFNPWFNRFLERQAQIQQIRTEGSEATVEGGGSRGGGAGGGGNGGRERGLTTEVGGRGPRGPEGPRPPEMSDKEWETSPERGRAIVKEILWLETDVLYADRYKVTRGLMSSDIKLGRREIYNAENGTYPDQLYKDLQDYTRAVRRIRNIRDTNDPWNPIRAYEKIKETIGKIAKEERISEVVQRLTGRTRNRGERPPETEIPAESLNNLYEQYLSGTAPESVKQNMAIYFREARAFGLFDRADDIFDATLRRIQEGGLSDDDQQSLLEENTQKARRAIEGALRAYGGSDLNKARLIKIAESYTQRTKDLFDRYLSRDPINLKEGEFRFGQDMDEEDDSETYWKPGYYPKTYDILARDEKQFRRAADTFLSRITRGRLGKSANQLYEHFNNFTERIGQAMSALPHIAENFSKALRQELEGRGLIFGADYSFETYNMRTANQFLMSMALDEGPDRWVQVARSGNGAVAAYLWKFDRDPRIKIMHNPGGSRGQLLNDTVTQHYLHAEIRNILIEEGMGVVMKDYDPRDPKSAAYESDSIRVLNLPEAEQARKQALAANAARIGIHQPMEEFIGLYDGFVDGDAHMINYQAFAPLTDEQLKTISPALRKSISIGKVQALLFPRVGRNHDGKDKKGLMEVIDKLIIEKRLTDRDKKFWEEAYDHSKANFATAFQMVGATGEKARRGGGVFFIDRKDERGRRFVDNMPVYEAEMFVQYVENRIKIEFANLSAQDRAEAVAEGREDAIQELKTNGYQAKIKFPKILFNTDESSPNFGDVIGFDEEHMETIDFETATDSENPLNKWLSHTYLSYQQENRHQITNPDVLKAAKRLRMILLNPELMTEEEKRGSEVMKQLLHEPLAKLRLIMDPTLNRVPSLQDIDMPEDMSSQQAEILFSDAAVEASNMGHWRIVRELNAVFMPKDGNMFKFRTGYNLEDYGGIARFIIRMRQFVASNPKRFARRYAAELVNLPLNVSSMPDQWGQAGVLGAIEMFADPVGDMSEQKLAGQFAITKWVEQMRIGNLIYDALVGHVDSEKGFSIEGLFEKPTNNAEMIARIQKLIPILNGNDKGKTTDYEAEEEFMKIALETFDRLWIILKLVRAMESDTRNAQGALDLENKEILKNGRPDLEILNDLAKNSDTGSSRHTEKQFFYAYIKWLTEGEGVNDYPLEAQFYKKLLGKSILDKEGKMTRADWLYKKMTR